MQGEVITMRHCLPAGSDSDEEDRGADYLTAQNAADARAVHEVETASKKRQKCALVRVTIRVQGP